MFRRLSIGQGFILAMMAVITAVSIVMTISFYSFFDNTTAEIVKNSSKEINKQVIMNYERYIDEVIETANYLDRRTIEASEMDDFDSLRLLFRQATEMSDDMSTIVLFNHLGDAVINSDTRPLASDLKDKSWFIAARRDREIFHFSAPHIQDFFDDGQNEVITVTKSVTYYDEGVLRYGVLAIDLTTENFVGLAQKTNLGENGHILILNEQSEFVYSSTALCVDSDCDSKKIVDRIILGGASVLLEDEHMYVNINTLKHTRWRIATFINVDNVYQARQSLTLVLITIVASSLGVALLLGFIMSNRISNPLNTLKKHMAKIEEGDPMSEVVITGQKEIVSLATTFNHMVLEITQLMERLLNEQKEKRKSEFLALQTQINPHFLYNTLDSIVWLAEKHRNEEVIEMVVALSHFFRISISRGKNIISVKDELSHAKNYLHIQKIRYNRKFDFRFEIDDRVMRYTVVKLVLQPIIENAIYHGMSSEDETGQIAIKAYIHEEKLVFEIENNGYGIIPEKIRQINIRMRQAGKADGVGLRNVYQRLKLYYGDEADVILSSDVDEMTNVKLIVPLRKDQSDEENH